MPGGSPFQRRYTQTGHTLAAGTKTYVWPSESDTNGTLQKALYSRYCCMTIKCHNTGGSNAVTASTVDASEDGTNWLTILNNTLTPAANTVAYEVLERSSHGSPRYLRLTLTSSSGTTVTTDVFATEM